PGDDPRARRFRRDLGRLNAFAMTHRSMAGGLLKHSGDVVPRELIDLCAGDGTFMLRVAPKLPPARPGGTVKVIDQQDNVNRSCPQQLCRTALESSNNYSRRVRIPPEVGVERRYHHGKRFPASLPCRAFVPLAWSRGKKDKALRGLRAKANALCTRGEPLRLAF